MPIIRVALDVPVNTLFDYLAPAATAQDIGARVQVPFGNKLMTGLIMEVAAASAVPAGKLKSAAQIFRDVPPLPGALLALFRFCSAYYHHPLGEVAMNALPGKLRGGKPFAPKPSTAGFRLTAAGRDADAASIPARSLVKHRLLAQLKTADALSRDQVRRLSPRAPQAMKELAALGWVETVPELPEIPSASLAAAAGPALTAEQQHAVAAITAEIDAFNVWLLHGITGSGKTEVYLRLISQLLTQGRQALLLVPEISLTPQLEAIFRARFPGTPLVSLHSGLNATERAQGWLQAQRGSARIILGTRLAVFTPLPALGLIIVDEEQDHSFKQQDGLRYSARDVAIFRGKQASAPVVLGSATPSLESYYNAATGRYRKLRLSARAVVNAALPTVRCIDTRAAKIREGLSEPLLAALAQCLAQGQQSLVFINRRGYAPVLLCKSCAWTATCHRCASRLVVHLREQRLRCHHCGQQQRIPAACPACGDQDITPFGHGTQRVEAALAERFPAARILRIDRDSIRRKDAWQQMLQAIHQRRVDILVGTQILAKGHDFPNLALVGTLNSDASLYSTDFRAAERLFAQLMQVAGRAGRAGTAGEVLVQTEFPDHPLYHALRRHDYDALAQTLLAERKTAGFPPFIHQALLRAEASQMDSAQAFLASAAAVAEPPENVQVFEPVPAQMARLQGLERAQLLVQSASRRQLQEFLAAWRKQLEALPARQVRWALDVDPLEF